MVMLGGMMDPSVEDAAVTPTEVPLSSFACIYALIVGILYYKTIKVKNLPRILIETMKMSSLSLFALATANALGELLSYYQLNVAVQSFFSF